MKVFHWQSSHGNFGDDLARRARPQLSADAVLAARKERLREILSQVRRDYL